MTIRSAPDVVLKCGCVTTEYGHVSAIGGKNKVQECPREHGWQPIKREADFSDRVLFYIYGQSVTQRKSAKSSERMHAMLRSGALPSAPGFGGGQQSLF